MTKRIGVLYFSPTNTTKMICDAVASGMGREDPQTFNLTLPSIRRQICDNPDGATANIDHLIVGAPVYFGKLPSRFTECLRSIRGSGKECSAIVVYGNRDYGIALYQMVEILSNNGFGVIGAGAFIGQHSYSDVVPVAIGRPDKSDIEKANCFGANSLSASGYLPLSSIPVQRDIFSKSDMYMPLKPVFISDLCVQCGICAKYCPEGILSSETGMNLSRAAEKQCIGCMACVMRCKTKARVARPNVMLKLAMRFILRRASMERQEPLTIFP
ncbi:4Fe-4S binding protein [Candidatus Eisenbacteria bacterium]|uniref:4Fe-4S binding protein n=1 Tax=Eiseniibacteriota bacterium TaxID=2212470 RepID=A0ABV6YNF7_UNCEI